MNKLIITILVMLILVVPAIAQERGGVPAPSGGGSIRPFTPPEVIPIIENSCEPCEAVRFAFLSLAFLTLLGMSIAYIAFVATIVYELLMKPFKKTRRKRR